MSESNIPFYEKVQSIKRNALLDVIVIQYRDWSEVKEFGLGFDNIDTLFITKDQMKNKEAMRTVRLYNWIRLVKGIKKI